MFQKWKFQDQEYCLLNAKWGDYRKFNKKTNIFPGRITILEMFIVKLISGS